MIERFNGRIAGAHDLSPGNLAIAGLYNLKLFMLDRATGYTG